MLILINTKIRLNYKFHFYPPHSNYLIKNEVFPEFFLGAPEIILGAHEIILGNTWNIIATFLNNNNDGLDDLNDPLNNEHNDNKIS